MKRKRQRETVAEIMLSHERQIRKAVEAERGGFSFLTAYHADGVSGRTGTADKTATKAIYLSEELPQVNVEGLGTVKRPETWLAVFDAVRWLAMLCQKPEIIFAEWRSRYFDGLKYFEENELGQVPDDTTSWGRVVLWIRYNVEQLALKAGIISAAACSIAAPV